MDIRKYFDYNPILDLTAAQIGINKWDWFSINNENETEALELMKKNRFDVLPISQNGKILKYFSTREWNIYNNLNLTKIGEGDTIYYRLSFIDLVRKFNKEERHFYFLTNYQEILGLVSYVNLNCQAVYNYLYEVFADIEQSIVYLLKKHIEQNDIIKEFKKSNDKHLEAVVRNFDESLKTGSDNSIFEHMYLQTIGITLNKFVNTLPVEFKILNKFSSKFSANGLYSQLRNKVMHPVRPILNEKETMQKIDELLKDYLEIKEILR
ncbi:hypothetical protein NF867_09350 [Solitalea sp. MAHUQ-68]|uniref:Uncharacterized protein n=1 Tax=Solitalea agri TaxID=2953739 RepID=A0A9X2F9T0_9SPHI|nr:hypothetical protein [Solitalea agri]MCO4293068.1 hypothetical protein [Solitalea agri]